MRPEGVGHKHLVTRVDEGRHGQEYGLVGAHRDHDLLCGIENQAVVALELVGDGLAQLGHPVVRGIVDHAVVQGLFGGLLDVGRGIEVGAAYAEVHDVLPLGLPPVHFLEDLADGGEGDVVHPVCSFHGS